MQCHSFTGYKGPLIEKQEIPCVRAILVISASLCPSLSGYQDIFTHNKNCTVGEYKEDLSLLPGVSGKEQEPCPQEQDQEAGVPAGPLHLHTPCS